MHIAKLILRAAKKDSPDWNDAKELLTLATPDGATTQHDGTAKEMESAVKEDVLGVEEVEADVTIEIDYRWDVRTTHERKTRVEEKSSRHERCLPLLF